MNTVFLIGLVIYIIGCLCVVYVTKPHLNELFDKASKHQILMAFVLTGITIGSWFSIIYVAWPKIKQALTPKFKIDRTITIVLLGFALLVLVNDFVQHGGTEWYKCLIPLGIYFIYLLIEYIKFKTSVK